MGSLKIQILRKGCFAMKAVRLLDKPIITPEMSESIGTNINGPSLIKAPEWLKSPLGKYYLYFSHHSGRFIRLAYADALEGPWTIYEPGALHLEQCPLLEQSAKDGHIASPDVLVDNENKRIVMYFHGTNRGMVIQKHITNDDQSTYIALSDDGVNFQPVGGIVGSFYWRVFKWDGYFYSIEMSGQVRRSINGLDNFEAGPVLKRDWDTRHMAVQVVGSKLYVYFSCRGDCPERIVYSTIDLTKDWFEWRESAPYETLLEPERDYEGADLPLEPSKFGLALKRERQLRDPAIYEENGDTYLLYSVAGESGIAIARLHVTP